MSGTYESDIRAGIRKDLWVTEPLRPSYEPEVIERIMKEYDFLFFRLNKAQDRIAVRRVGPMEDIGVKECQHCCGKCIHVQYMGWGEGDIDMCKVGSRPGPYGADVSEFLDIENDCSEWKEGIHPSRVKLNAWDQIKEFFT